jgi:CBS domain-containing protein
MLVKEIMTTSVKTARPTDPVRDIATIMCFNKISGLPVVDGEGSMVGMISEKDILHAMFPKLQDFIANPSTPDFEKLEREYRDVVSLRVADLMTAIVYTAEPDMPVLKAASIMFRNRIRRIPVSQGGRLLGIISIGDVHKAMFRKTLTLPV